MIFIFCLHVFAQKGKEKKSAYMIFFSSLAVRFENLISLYVFYRMRYGRD